jgi:hypothetical protein
MNLRLRLILVGLGGLLVVAVFTFPLWRPLFVHEVVDEVFPGLPEDMKDNFLALPQDQRDMLVQMYQANKNDAELSDMALETALAILGGDQQVAEDMSAMSDAVVIVSGDFEAIDALHKAEGSATVYQLPDDSLVLRLDDFHVTNGPDLRVFLAKPEAPRSRSDLGTDYRDLGRLKGNVGSQNYAIPADVNIDDFKSVVIYSAAFHVVFSTATLS